jgi:hypothetical protein
MHESATEVTAIVAGSTVVVLATLLPLMRWARAKRLAPRWLRALPATTRKTAFQVALSGLALLFICTPSNGATS